MAELAKLDRGDGSVNEKFTEFLIGQHLRAMAHASLPTSNSGAFYFSIAGMLMFVLAVGAGPVHCLLIPELLPSLIRTKAMAFCLNLSVGLMFLHLLELFGPELLYSIFGTFCLMAVVFVKRNVVKT